MYNMWCNMRYIAVGLSQSSVGQAYTVCVHLYTMWCNMRDIAVGLTQPSVGQAYSKCVHRYTIGSNVRFIAVDLSQSSVGSSRLYVVVTALKHRLACTQPENWSWRILQ